MESAFQTGKSQKGLLVTLNCDYKYQKTSLKLWGTKLMNILLKRDSILQMSFSSNRVAYDYWETQILFFETKFYQVWFFKSC